MSGRASHRLRRGLVASALAVVAPLVVAGCVAEPPPRSSPGTTTFASRTFCEPVQALSVDAWTDRDPRALVAGDLAAARNHAPSSLHPVLDTLIELEAAGIHPGAGSTAPVAPGGTERTPLARWFDAMSTLSDVAGRECNIDLAAGAGAGTVPGAPTLEGKPAGSAELGPADVVELVRSRRPDARWVDRAVIGAVSSGDGVQVSVVGVDDQAMAVEICTDLLAALPTRTDPPSVTVRNTPGLVIVAGESGSCAEVPHP